MDEVHAAAQVDSYIHTAIRKYSELFLKAGYAFKGMNDDAVTYLEQRLRIMSYTSDNAFDLLLRETANDLMEYSNAFWIKTRVDSIPYVKAKGILESGECVGGYFRVDPRQMRIKFDKNGNVSGYQQVTPSNKDKKFDVNDVIHFTFDREAGSQWGKPYWLPVLDDIRALRSIEGNATTLCWRYAIPMIHAQVGLAKDGLYGTRKEIEDTQRVIERTPTDGLLVTNERVNLKAIGVEGNALDISPYLTYYENRVFTGLNVSQAMMGRGGSKQDADSMEEQVHNAVKDDQATFAIQFQHEVITELLLEGGFNPILNEDDIVNLEFNEINLDTKVKVENHEINLYHSNAITFEEMRNSIGYKNNNVDEKRLYSNMIEQKNALEQIEVNHENAIELAKLNSDLTMKQNEQAAELSSTDTDIDTENEPDSDQQSQNNIQTSTSTTSSRQYAKKNTGNGKNVTTGRTNNAVKNTDSPQNQHGTFSAKIKEMKESVILDMLSDEIQSKQDLEAVKEKTQSIIRDSVNTGSIAGAKTALDDIEPDKDHDFPKLAPQNTILESYIKKNLNRCFQDITDNIGNTTDRDGARKSFCAQKYRLDSLSDFAYRKAFWYSYVKTCESHGVKQVRVVCREESRHRKEHHGKIINVNQFSINDIPGYSTNCRCCLEPVQSET